MWVNSGNYGRICCDVHLNVAFVVHFGHDPATEPQYSLFLVCDLGSCSRIMSKNWLRRKSVLCGFAVPADEQVAATIAPDLQAVIASRTETIANLPFPLDVVKPDIFVKEAVAGGVLCQALLWSAQNMVRAHRMHACTHKVPCVRCARHRTYHSGFWDICSG